MLRSPWRARRIRRSSGAELTGRGPAWAWSAERVLNWASAADPVRGRYGETVSMRQPKSSICLCAALGLMAAHYAWADNMRCGNKLIQAGDSMVTVKALCGAPAAVEHGVEEKGPVEVTIETWTYDRGPDQFMVRIRFVDGKAAWIKTLHEYGH